MPDANDSRRHRCARCQTAISLVSANVADAIHEPFEMSLETVTAPTNRENAPQLDLPGFDDDLRAATKLVRRVHARLTSLPLPEPTPHENEITASRGASAEDDDRAAHEPNDSATTVHGNFSLVTTSLVVGGIIFVYGATLLIGSIWQKRPDLWNAGLPIVLLGQVALAVGLVLQLERLWRGNRATEQTLRQLDGELRRIRQTPTGSSHRFESSESSLDDVPSPQQLLADLKQRLDHVSRGMS